MIAGARAARAGAGAPTRPRSSRPPVATVKQIMNGIVGPAATAVFDSVEHHRVDRRASRRRRRSTDEEWEAVGNSAAALIESGNLLLMGNRAVDKGDWVKMSQAHDRRRRRWR